MSSKIFNIIIEQGATCQREFTVTPIIGTLDLTTCTLSTVLKDSRGMTVPNAITATATAADKVLMELTDEISVTLPINTNSKYPYRVLATTPSGITYCIALGSITII